MKVMKQQRSELMSNQLKLKKRLFSAYIVLSLITIGFIGLMVFESVLDQSIINKAQANTIIVDKGGGGDYEKIQQAVDNANPGDTILIKAASYNEKVLVNKTLTLKSYSKVRPSIHPFSPYYGLTIKANWVNVTNITFQSSGPSNIGGISLSNSDNCKIENCWFSHTLERAVYMVNSDNNILRNLSTSSNSEEGILLRNSHSNILENITSTDNRYTTVLSLVDSNSNLITNSTFSKHYLRGIELENSNSNLIRNCTINNNTLKGIFLYSSNSNKIINNSIEGNLGTAVYIDSCKSTTILNNSLEPYGIYIEKAPPDQWNTHVIDTNNTVSGKPVYYFKNESNITVPDGGSQVIIGNCQNVLIENQNYSDVSAGILIGHSLNIKIKNCTLNSNLHEGILLHNSTKNKITDTICDDNSAEGIIISYSDSNIIRNNSVLNNKWGIDIEESNENDFINNTCKNNTEYGNCY